MNNLFTQVTGKRCKVNRRYFLGTTCNCCCSSLPTCLSSVKCAYWRRGQAELGFNNFQYGKYKETRLTRNTYLYHVQL